MISRPAGTLFLAVIAFALGKPPLAAAQDTLSLYGLGEAGRRPFDPNGFLFNPAWRNPGKGYPDIERRCRFRVTTGHLEERSLFVTTGPCLSQAERRLVTLNETPTTLVLGGACYTNSRSGSVKGHVNWFPVTATGQLRWKGYSKGAGDHDLTMDLIPPESNALTRGNGSATDTSAKRPGYHIEFYADETLGRLERGSGFWEDVRVGVGDKKTMRGLLDDRVAIVTGLYGLDGVHGLHAELHPAYSLSILRDVTHSPGKTIEEWAVMVRNIGNEGDCSAGKIPLEYPSPGSTARRNFVIDFGWWQGAMLGAVRMGRSWSVTPTEIPAYRAEDGHLYVGFRHDVPLPGGPDFLFLGTILIEWNKSDSAGWAARFEPWLATSHRKIALGQPAPPAPGEAPGKVASEDSAATAQEQEAYGIEDPRPLLPFGPMPLVPLEQWDAATGVSEPDPAIPWLVAHPTGHECQDTPKRLEVCSNGWRWMVTPLSYNRRAGHTPSLGIYLRPHGAPTLERMGNFGRMAGIFGYRWEARRDRYISRDSAPKRLEGTTFLLLSPTWEPLTGRVGPVEVSPYAYLGLGFSFLNRAPKGAFTFEQGAGLQIHLGSGRPGLFIETNKKARRGVLSHHSFSAGLILAGPFFKDYGHKQKARTSAKRKPS